MKKRKISYDLNLPEDKVSKVKTLLEKNTRYSTKYPWTGLEDFLEEQKKTTLKIVGYGSLINDQSAAVTVTVRSRIPVIAFGVYRIFNYLIPYMS